MIQGKICKLSYLIYTVEINYAATCLKYRGAAMSYTYSTKTYYTYILYQALEQQTKQDHCHTADNERGNIIPRSGEEIVLGEEGSGSGTPSIPRREDKSQRVTRGQRG